MHLRQQWGRTIRDHRERLGHTQQQLAELVGCAQETLSAWERGKSAPPDAARLALAQEFCVPAEELFPYTLAEVG